MLLGKALYDRQFLDMPLTKTFYKLVLNEPVRSDDLMEVDETLNKVRSSELRSDELRRLVFGGLTRNINTHPPSMQFPP